MKRKHPSRRRVSVLAYSQEKASQATVNRQYRKWRKDHDVPDRCDNRTCQFHRESLVWNGHLLPVILDHIDGNRRDNRPEKLRFLCPNCDSQLDTRGGASKGRVKTFEQGFAILSRDGHRTYTYFAAGGLRFGGTGNAQFVQAPAKK